MAGFIIIEADIPEKEWSSANWVFAGFLDHTISMLCGDDEAVSELTACKYNQNVDLDDLNVENPELRERILSAFKQSCYQIASGMFPVSVNGHELEEVSQIEYRNAIRRLCEILERECGNESQQ